MRLTALILVIAAIAAPAAAQDRALLARERLRDVQTENSLAAQQDLTRQQLLAAERQAFAREQRARIAASLQSLEARVALAVPLQPAPLDPQLSAEATANAQARYLAESNARMQAIMAGEEPQ